MSDHFTKLPAIIEEIMLRHHKTMWLIVKFLKSKRFKTDPSSFYGEEHFTRRTRINIQIMHDNDYIEMGIGAGDERGERFHIITTEKVAIVFKSRRYPNVLKFFSKLDKDSFPENLQHVRFNFIPWRAKIETPSLDMENLKIELKFRVMHQFDRSDTPMFRPGPGGVL